MNALWNAKIPLLRIRYSSVSRFSPSLSLSSLFPSLRPSLITTLPPSQIPSLTFGFWLSTEGYDLPYWDEITEYFAKEKRNEGIGN